MDKSHNEKNDFYNRENNSDKEQLPTTGHGYGYWALGTWKSVLHSTSGLFPGLKLVFYSVGLPYSLSIVGQRKFLQGNLR